MKKWNKRLLSLFLTMAMLFGCFITGTQAATIPKYHNIASYQQKDVYATAKVKISGIKVVDDTGKSVEASVKFKIFNSTKQEVESTVTSKDGVLPDLKLIKDHNYIIFSEDPDYQMAMAKEKGKMNHAYIWVKGENNIVDIKNFETDNVYSKLTKLTVSKRTASVDDPEAEDRTMINLPVWYGTEEGLMRNVKFKLVSAIETIETTSGNKGKLSAALLEDVTYMVTVDSDQYDVESFPLVIKDKSEYLHQNIGIPGGKYPYNHSSCAAVYSIQLLDKGNAHKNDTTLTSISGKTTVSGLNFKDFLLFEKKYSNRTITQLSGKDYDVFDIKIVNPHRWEVSKLAAGSYKITETIANGKLVDNVYYVDDENNLQKLSFTQSGTKVSFKMKTMSMYPVVIVYNPKAVKVQKVVVSGSYKKVAAGKSVQLKALVSPSNAKNKAVTWKSSNKKYASVSASGKVTAKKAGAGKTITITATAKDGSKKYGTYKITVMKDAVTGIALKAASVVKAGRKITVKATIKVSGKRANKRLKWTSSNTKYASVSSKGVVTTKKAGKGKTVTITAAATDGSGKKKTVKIKIK